MQFRFGKYSGCDLQDIPTNYLHWAINNVDLWPKLKAALLAELDERRESADPRARISSPDISVLLEIVQSGRRTLAMKYHLDRGGDACRMKLVNHAADFLESHVKTAIGAP